MLLKRVAPQTAKLELLSYLHRQTLVGSVHGQVRGRASLSLTSELIRVTFFSQQLSKIALTDVERKRRCEELDAANRLEQWLTNAV